jgi:hypothetical protein
VGYASRITPDWQLKIWTSNAVSPNPHERTSFVTPRWAVFLPLGSHLTPTIAADPFWGFSLDNLDRTCNPCDNFYQFAMGGWIKNNPIPPEYPSWGTFAQLRDDNLSVLTVSTDR